MPVSSSKPRVCKDCVRDGVTTARPAPHPGPRCVTHHREVKRQRKTQAHDRAVSARYGIPSGSYDRLYEVQGGSCAGCQRARGRTRHLAVDHDHKTGEVRGLLCYNCNYTLAHFRDDAAALRRLADYLDNPPARQLNLGHFGFYTQELPE